jgi:hypothetical protein
MSETYDLPGVGDGWQPSAGPAPGPQQPASGPGSAQDADPPEQPAPVAEPEPAPEPLGVVLAETGNAEVDTAVDRLRDADELPVHAHIEVYEDVHRGLRDALTALDENRG